MAKEEIEKEWQKALKSFVDEYNEKVDGMSEEEEKKYIRENRINEKLNKLKEKFLKKYEKKSTQK